MNKKLLHNLIIIFFLSVPVISSFVSTIHIVDFFYLGNYKWIAILLAISFEFGAIASFIALSVLEKINKYIIIFIFIILFLMQMIGNIYFSYDFISQKIIVDGTWLNSFNELIQYIFMIDNDIIFSKIILSILIGVPIPLISISFLKSLVDYLNIDNENKDNISDNINTNDINDKKDDVVNDIINKNNKHNIDDDINVSDISNDIINDSIHINENINTDITQSNIERDKDDYIVDININKDVIEKKETITNNIDNTTDIKEINQTVDIKDKTITIDKNLNINKYKSDKNLINYVTKSKKQHQ